MVDTDRDGIADDIDNCPSVANPDQADEDNDGIGDACDPCPIVAGSSSVDTDGDHIPDACDPHPAVAGDTLVAFSGFKAGVVPTGWTVSGTVTAANGDVELISTSAISNGTAVMAPDAAFGNGAITALVTLDTALAVGTETDAGIMVSLLNPTTGDNIQCGLYQQDVTKPTTRELDLYDSLANNGQGADLKTGTFAWVPGTSYQVTLARQGNNYTCSAAPMGGSPTSITASTGSAPAGGVPCVLNYDGTGHVGYLLVIHSP
jgi:hypothetical protein